MQINNEIWKDIEGYEGIYQVSSLGNVRSIDRVDIISDGRIFRRKGKILKHKLCRKGYHRVQLYLDSKGKHCNIHRLVAISFISNPYSLAQVNHINGDKGNNTMDNLEWITNADNFSHARDSGLLKLDGASKPIEQLTIGGEFIKKYPSGLQAQRETGIYTSGISMCARGLYKQYKGFIWRYAND